MKLINNFFLLIFFGINIPAYSTDLSMCVACHNPTQEANPILSGQHSKYIEKQLRDARDAEGRPLAPQQNNTTVPRSDESNSLKPRNARQYSSGGQGMKERLRGKQSEPLMEPDDQPQEQ